ncbi:DNA polymerase III subunit gamma and tau [Rhodococcus gannanensis]|uniref:DNA polymerase III subunit gamma/tau n=1 Tax=Rhodococcus gannanensis TaxID=1960308 RepID=A0ABW4P0M1_9NOCA
MALYRKYRPATFAEVVGQEHVTEPLSTALDAGRINHAYLFSGPRGCGKTSSARILARSLNCVQGPTSTPCGTCHSCVALGPGGPGNLDVIELDAASHGGVDDTRELRDRAFYAPAESRYRIFIVDEAHMVTTQGFNALLKIVEEPPEHLIFVFATTEPEKVLPTIRSRTHHYPFRLLAPNTMRGLLEKICAQEHVAVQDAVYPLVIRAGGGSPRDSLSVLDQLLAGAGDEGVTYPRALSLLGVTDVALIDEAVDALAAGDGASLFGTVDKVMDAGHDPRRFAVDLLERIRDLILMRAVPDAGDRGLVDAPGDVLERMREESERIGPATLARYAELLHAGLGEMRGATAPRLLLEVICARMLLPAASDAESAVLQRLERLEKGGVVASGAPAAASTGIAQPAVSAAPADGPPPRFQRPSQRKQAETAHVEQPASAVPPEPGVAAPAEPAPVESAAAAPPAPVGAPDPMQAASPEPSLPDTASVVVSAEPAVAVEAAPTASPEPDVVPEPAVTPDAVEAPAPEVPAAEPAAPQPVVASTPEPAVEEPAAVDATVSEDVVPQTVPAVEDTAVVEPAATPEPAAPVSAGPDAAAVRAAWSEVRAKVRDRSRTVEVMLSGASVRAVGDGRIVLVHASAPLAKRLTEPRNADVIRQALHEVFGVDWSVDCQVGSAEDAAPPKAAPRPQQAKPASTPRFSRPSQAQAVPRQAPASRPDPAAQAPVDDIPPPDEPDYPHDPGPLDYDPPTPDSVTPEDEEEMMAEAAEPADPSVRRDPDEVALELLADMLGAKPIEG